MRFHLCLSTLIRARIHLKAFDMRFPDDGVKSQLLKQLAENVLLHTR